MFQPRKLALAWATVMVVVLVFSGQDPLADARPVEHPDERRGRSGRGERRQRRDLRLFIFGQYVRLERRLGRVPIVKSRPKRVTFSARSRCPSTIGNL
jgi:hypothetical protein